MSSFYYEEHEIYKMLFQLTYPDEFELEDVYEKFYKKFRVYTHSNKYMQKGSLRKVLHKLVKEGHLKERFESRKMSSGWVTITIYQLVES